MKKFALLILPLAFLVACGDDDVDSPPPTGPVAVEEDASEYALPRLTTWVEVKHPLGGTIWCLSGGYLDGAVLWCDPSTRTEQ